MEKNEIKVSIIIPVYNVEKYLSKCLDSVLKQTLKEIEIICVDDCSQDTSLDILNKYAKLDKRVKVVHFEENKSSSLARKLGVNMATGKYILFVDADDTLELNACEFLYEKINDAKVDVLHFGTKIRNCADLPEQRVKNMEKFVLPYTEKVLEGKEVFLKCFKEKKYQFSLWNKMYNADVVRQAFEYVEDIVLPKAQDKYAYFLISYFSNSYMGIVDTFYNYNFGLGVTGHNYLDIETYKKYCTMGATAEAIGTFLKKVNAYEQYYDVYEASKIQLLNDCTNNWYNVSPECQAEAFDMILDYFDASDVIANFAKHDWWDNDGFVKRLEGSQKLHRKKKEIKTVATYYHKLECGGVQMVLTKLAAYWLEKGYKVIVLTDCPPTEGDYELPEQIERIVIPSFFEITKDNYLQRSKVLQEIIKEKEIDALVYHAWVSQILLWDLMICKLNDVKFIIHCHNIFSMPTRNLRVFFTTLPYVYSLADCVITLSDSDTEYWSNFNNNVVQVTNPVRYDDLSELDTVGLTTHNIIWCARFSDEKRPLDAVEIFKCVHKELPTAKLFMLGKGEEKILAKVREKIQEYKLENEIFLFGYQKDVLPFYSLSSVNLMTSEYEGYPLSLLEAMSVGIPTVMYDLPYLSVMKKNEGIISVQNRSITGMAEEIVTLLKNTSELQRRGSIARKYAENVVSYNYASVWEEIFNNTADFDDEYKEISLMWETLLGHINEGTKKNNKTIQDLNATIKSYKEAVDKCDRSKMVKVEVLEKRINDAEKELTKAKKAENAFKFELHEIKKSFSYKLGLFFTWIPRKVKAFCKRRK